MLLTSINSSPSSGKIFNYPAWNANHIVSLVLRGGSYTDKKIGSSSSMSYPILNKVSVTIID